VTRVIVGVGAALFVGCLNSLAWAQTVPAPEDGARVSERFATPVAPLSTGPAVKVVLESTEPPASASAVQLSIANITVSGSSVYSAAEWQEMTTGVRGQVPLSAIYDLAQTLTARYSADGYFLSRVIVPPQELDPTSASVRLEVVEGWIDEVVWPAEIAGYRDFFSYYSRKITAERPVTITTLERYLLLAGDLPGFEFESTLEPSTDNPGASRLVLTTKQKGVEAFAAADNQGTDGRGPYQFSTGLTLNNALRQHERLSGAFSGSFETDELLYGQLRYDQVLNAEGLTAALSVTADGGKPGTTQLRTLMFESRSLTFVGELSFPLIRTRTQNLSLFGNVFAKNYQSDALGSRFNEDRLRGVRAGFRYDRFDQWNGITQFSATVSQGIDGLGSTANSNLLASRASGRVDFSKIEASLTRFQSLGQGFSLVGRLNGQYAGTPLLSSEECGYGGSTFGRGFDSSALTGDHCLLAMAELRYDVPSLPDDITQAQVFGFADYGKVWRRAPVTGVAASANAASAGAGLRLGWQDRLSAELTVAKRIHGSAGTNDWRATFSLSARY
jgi:hemolysin activation/secretion protein